MTWQSHIVRRWPSWDSQGSKQPGPRVHALGHHVSPPPPQVERGSLPVPWKHERSCHHYSHKIGDSGTVSFKRSVLYAFKRVWSSKWSGETSGLEERQVQQHQAPGNWMRITSAQHTTSLCQCGLPYTIQLGWSEPRCGARESTSCSDSAGGISRLGRLSHLLNSFLRTNSSSS